jgi:hypothetical protein
VLGLPVPPHFCEKVGYLCEGSEGYIVTALTLHDPLVLKAHRRHKTYLHIGRFEHDVIGGADATVAREMCIVQVGVIK